MQDLIKMLAYRGCLLIKNHVCIFAMHCKYQVQYHINLTCDYLESKGERVRYPCSDAEYHRILDSL